MFSSACLFTRNCGFLATLPYSTKTSPSESALFFFFFLQKPVNAVYVQPAESSRPPQPHFYKLHFNIILQSVFRSIKPPPVFTLSTNPLYVFLTCPFTSHSPPILTLHHSMTPTAISLSCAGLFKMTVGVLTTCHTQYTLDSSICVLLFNRTTLQVFVTYLTGALYVHPL